MLPSRWIGPLALVLAIAAPAGAVRAESVALVDDQVNVIDYPISGWLSVYNRSATYLVTGGSVRYSATLYQSSWFEMSGGWIGYDLTAYTSSELYLFGGSVGSTLRANTYATIDWSGGNVRGDVVADGSSTIRIYGAGFSVDDAPVPYGPLAPAEGILRGTLNDGTAIAVPFHHAGALFDGAPVTGTIELVDGEPVQSPAPDYSHEIALLNDGGVHDVDDDRYDDRPRGVRLRSPAAPTTLNVLPGAELGYSLSTRDDSVLDVSGGHICYRRQSAATAVTVGGETDFQMTGGTIHCGATVERSARAEISGGTLTRLLWLHHDAELYLSGGFLDWGVTAYDSSYAEISGGFLGSDLIVGGQAALRGGDLWGDLIAEFTGEIEIVGSSFQYYGVPLPFGELTAEYGELTGILESGELLDVFFQRRSRELSGGERMQGRITLVPEPGRALLMAVGIACIAALHARRSR